MRGFRFLLLALVLSFSDHAHAHAHAQGWVEYINREDAFIVNFPGTPDVRALVAHAAQGFRTRGGEVTYDAWADIDKIEGHQPQITNPDESRSFVAIHLHASRLYILEATVTPGAPPPGLFQQSLGILDEEGGRIRYRIDAEGIGPAFRLFTSGSASIPRTLESS